MTSTDLASHCPCCSGRRYERCCEPYLTGQKAAPTAEALMRSRYSAFHAGNADYLIETHHPDNRAPNERSSLEASINNTQWLNLIVLGTQKGQRKDKQGSVEFVAAYCAQAPTSPVVSSVVNPVVSPVISPVVNPVREIQQLRERSQFVKEDGRWFYTSGEPRSPFVPKRNQPCWCGSGKKFKQCHEKI